MWKKTGLRWLVLSFLVHCVHTDDSSTSASTTAKPATTAAATAATAAANATATAATTAATTAAATAATTATTGATTTAPVKTKTAAAPTTMNSQPTTKPQLTLTTTVKPTTKAVTTGKPITLPAGSGAVQPTGITTESKQEPPGSTTPKGGNLSPPPQVKTTPSNSSPPPPSPSGHTTKLPQTQTQTPAPKGPSQTPDTKTLVTTRNRGTTVTHTVTNLTVVTAMKREEKNDKGAVGTTAAQPTTPHQNGSVTASPRTSAPQISTKATTAPTRGTGTSPNPHESRVLTSVQTSVQTTLPTVTTVSPPVFLTFSYWLNSGVQPGVDKDLVAMCQQLMTNYEDGKCNLTFTESNGQKKFTSAEISGKVKPTIINQVSEDIHSQKSHYKMTLMIILGTCLPLVVMLVVFVLCVSHRCKPYSETQRPLTDELQAVENGYHDNPTLEVMEVQGVEPEKKMALNLNGEFNDSWIVPMDNLLKDDGPDEEDTHL